jgi:hypothetical protein
VDNRRYKAAGFHYQHTSRETVQKLAEHLRLHPVVRGAQEPYRYEREVEEFLRWSPHVKNTRDKATSALSREQLAELQRLLTSFADTAGMDLEDDVPDRAAEAERRAAAAEQAAREAADRAAGAEEAAGARLRDAEARAQEAEERARAEAAAAAENASREAEDRVRQAEERARGQAAAAEQAAREAADRAARAEQVAEERARAAEARAREEDARRSSGRPPDHYDDLAAEEVIALLASLEHEDLQMLREYERDHANRTRVLSAIESVLSRRGSRV